MPSSSWREKGVGLSDKLGTASKWERGTCMVRVAVSEPLKRRSEPEGLRNGDWGGVSYTVPVCTYIYRRVCPTTLEPRQLVGVNHFGELLMVMLAIASIWFQRWLKNGGLRCGGDRLLGCGLAKNNGRLEYTSRYHIDISCLAYALRTSVPKHGGR